MYPTFGGAAGDTLAYARTLVRRDRELYLAA